MSDRPILYSFWRSSTSYRVRIALNLKGIAYETVAVNLEANGGEHHRASYRRLNPEQMVPVLSDGGRVIRQSLAIIEYLDARHAQAPLLIPREPLAAAQVRGLALTIACDVQPFGPARVLGYLERTFGANEAQRQAWMRHWIAAGCTSIEAILATDAAGKFCVGDSPTLADCCLVPQVYNARRLGLDLSPYPTLLRIDAACRVLEPFRRAVPEVQPGAPAPA